MNWGFCYYPEVIVCVELLICPFLLIGRGNSGYSSRSRGGRGGGARGRGGSARVEHRNDREGSETSERGGSFR